MGRDQTRWVRVRRRDQSRCRERTFVAKRLNGYALNDETCRSWPCHSVYPWPAPSSWDGHHQNHPGRDVHSQWSSCRLDRTQHVDKESDVNGHTSLCLGFEGISVIPGRLLVVEGAASGVIASRSVTELALLLVALALDFRRLELRLLLTLSGMVIAEVKPRRVFAFSAG